MERDEVINTLRACLLSAKGGVKMEDLNKDYKMLNGDNIPYQKLGFLSLEAFLRTVPKIRIINKGGDSYVEAQPIEESAHLSKLISRQKSAPKKARKKLVDSFRNSTSFREPNPRKGPRAIRGNINENIYHSGYGTHGGIKENIDYRIGRPNVPLPLMEIPVKHPITSNERPRYVQHTPGGIPSSPSKRMKDKQINSMSSTLNQSVNKSKDNMDLKSVNTVINQKPKTGYNNTENYGKGKQFQNVNDRLKINVNISSPPTNMSTTSQSELLSPLSPAQLIAGSNNTQLHLPSTNPSGSTNIKKNVPKFDSNDPREELRICAQLYNLSEPVYKILPARTKNVKEPSIYAHVKIGHLGHSSYPQEARTEDEAQKLAASIALVELKNIYGSISGISETTNKNLIKERIVAIVNNHPNGVFMHQVPVYYKQQYKENLPGNWQKIIEEYPALMLEKGVDNSTILRRFVSHSGKAAELPSLKSDKIQLNPIGPAAPGQLQLPKDEFWIVYVTYVISTVDVWVRLVGEAYSDQFDVMTAKMIEHYSSQVRSSVKPLTIEVGKYYAVYEDDAWHRVRCIEYNSTTKEAAVVFIDHGDEDRYHHSKLHTLDKKFCVLPAQAMRMCLAGLEDFSDCESVVNLIEKLLLGHAFYVEVLNHGTDQEGLYATVIFYDTHGPEDVNLNTLLSKQILQNVITAPKLEVGQVTEVFVSHVEESGDVYIQIQSGNMKHLINLLNRRIHTGLNADDLERSSVNAIDTTKIYFVSFDGNWYRGKVTNICADSQVQMFLIDFGKTVTTGKKNLLLLEKLSDILAKYPPQALKVHLRNIEKSMFTEKMIARFNEIAPRNEPLILKVVTFSATHTPIVELFKRIQISNMLVSINTTLVYEEELTRLAGDGNNNIKPRKRIERLTSRIGVSENDEPVRSLKPPKISGIGEYFDVHVTMAAQPGNFTVQPFDSKNALEEMMIKLQDVCLNYNGPHPTSYSVKEGKLYAGEHIDNHWYRVCILNIISENTVTVYFCDFGDVSVLTLDKLQPLKSQFLELPYQAIKARLVGIKPVNIDWSVEDCLRFQELVVDRNFVSIVVESGPDNLSPADTVLGLKLIDVDTSEDIYIDQLLVEEGRAAVVDS